MAPEEIKRIAEEISEKSITVLKNSDVIPLDNSIQDIFLILPHKGRYIEDELRKKVHQLKTCYYSLNPEKSRKDQIIKETRNAGLIIIATYNAYTNSEQESLVKEIMALNKPVVIIPLGLPYDISLFKDSTCILTGYGYTRPSAQALIKVLFGEIEAKGKLPVKIDLLGKE
jgi:beta-N-acetylhexosaminidase